MNDSFFRKEIQKKIAEGKEVPSNQIWQQLDEKLTQRRAAKKGISKQIYLFLLLPFLMIGVSYFIFFKGTKKVSEIAVNETSQGLDSSTETKKESTVLMEKEILKNKTPELNKEITRPNSKRNQAKGFETNEKTNEFLVEKAKTIIDGEEPEKENLAASEFNYSNTSTEESILETTKESEQIVHLPLLTQQNSIVEWEHEKFDEKLQMVEIEPIKSDKKLNRLWINGGYGLNNLEYCFNHKSTQHTFELIGEYFLTKNIVVGTGLNFNSLNYQFEIDSSIHLAAFGNTDKYPLFYESKEEIKAISNQLSYFSVPLKLAWHQPIKRGLAVSLGINQNFSFSQNQELSYSYFDVNGNSIFPFEINKIQLGLTTFQLGLHQELSKKINIGLSLNRSISYETLGVERQYYHGFGTNFSLRYSL